MINSFGTRRIDKGATHRSGSPSNFTEASLQDVGRSDRLPVLFWELIIGQAFAEILGQTLDGGGFLDLPLFFPGFEVFESITTCGRTEDHLTLAHESLPVTLFGLGLDVGHLVPDATLMTLIRKETLQRCLESRVTVGRNESYPCAFETTGLEIDQELGPVVFGF